eukprot:scaffold310_cov335-Pavlova_lutheri.AAC.21
MGVGRSQTRVGAKEARRGRDGERRRRRGGRGSRSGGLEGESQGAGCEGRGRNRFFAASEGRNRRLEASKRRASKRRGMRIPDPCEESRREKTAGWNVWLMRMERNGRCRGNILAWWTTSPTCSPSSKASELWCFWITTAP